MMIFAYDPFIGCPFDDSQMRIVGSWKGFSVGDTVEFQDLCTTHHPWLRGKIVSIGENAKYLNGDPFIAFAIRVGVGNRYVLKTHREIHHIV